MNQKLFLCLIPFSFAALTILCSTMATPASAKGFFDPFAHAGLQVGEAASQAGKEVGRAVQNTGREVGRGVQNAGREIGRGAKNVERFGRRAKTGLVRDYEGQQPPNPYRFTVSRFFSDSLGIGRGAGSLSSFGFEYDTRLNRLLGGPTVIGLFADVNTGGRYGRNNSAEYDADIIGVGVQARRIFAESLDSRHFYVGGGVGFYGTRYTVDPLGPARYKKTDYSGGLRLLGGYHFDRSLYVQCDILAIDPFTTRNANGARVRVNPSGARFGVGYRF